MSTSHIYPTYFIFALYSIDRFTEIHNEFVEHVEALIMSECAELVHAITMCSTPLVIFVLFAI